MVKWKRGKQQTSTSQVFELTTEKTMHSLFHEFQRESSFYSKAEVWEKKTCVFEVHKLEDGNFRKVADKEVDMSQFINQYNAKSTVHFDKQSEKNMGLYLDLCWNIRDPSQ